MKPLVIFHDHCADGFAAAFAAWLKLGDEAEYVPMQYGHAPIDSMLGKDRKVYILDFSLPKPQMEQLLQVAKKVVWLDHHKSAFEMWCGGIPEDGVYMCSIGGIDQGHFIWLHNEKSGAVLAWEYFHPGTEVPMLIRHIDDYDRWVFAIEGTKAFQKALWSYAPWSFDDWRKRFLNKRDLWSESPVGSDLSTYYAEGNAILRAHDQNVQSVVKGAARKCEIPFNEEAALDCVEPCLEWNDGGYWMVQGLAANCPPHLTSDVGHELANQSGTFGLLWFIDKENVCRCSLRSNGDYDVSAIAKAFGGGGHKNAAGFTIDIQTLLGWLK